MVDVDTRIAIEEFLYREARLLDERRFDEWLELFAEDGRYEIPLRVNRDRDAEWELSPNGRIFDDTKQTLAIRVERLGTEFAWAEQPPSRTRHVVTNVLPETTGTADEFVVRSNTLVYRSRGDDGHADLVSADRRDVLRRTAEGWRIVHRWAAIDQSTVSARTLSFFI